MNVECEKCGRTVRVGKRGEVTNHKGSVSRTTPCEGVGVKAVAK